MTRWAPESLVLAAIAGQGSAAEELLAAIWPACFRLAASLIGDPALAQDAAQDTCVIVYRKIRTLQSAGAFDAWMYRIVTRESSRIRRRLTPASPPSYDLGVSNDTTEAMDVWRALGSLQPPLRDVTVLFYFDDLPTDEIAAILGIPHATVRTRLLRAREHLRPLLEVKQHAI